MGGLLSWRLGILEGHREGGLTSSGAKDGDGVRAKRGTLCERIRLGTPSATGTATTTGRCPPPCPTPAGGTGTAGRWGVRRAGRQGKGWRYGHLRMPRPRAPRPLPHPPSGRAATRSPRLGARRGTAALRAAGPLLRPPMAKTPLRQPGGSRSPAAEIRAASGFCVRAGVVRLAGSVRRGAGSIVGGAETWRAVSSPEVGRAEGSASGNKCDRGGHLVGGGSRTADSVQGYQVTTCDDCRIMYKAQYSGRITIE
jgi:hypothetical protein